MHVLIFWARGPWGHGPIQYNRQYNTIGNTIGNSIGNSIKQNPISPIPLSKIFWFFKDVYEKGILPYWREGMYDQLLWRIRKSLWNICRLVNKSVKYWTCQNVPRPKNTFVAGFQATFWDFGHLQLQKVDFITMCAIKQCLC